jgi:divalent metal cation (Fe/Co/Zn/Cd) transporter
VRITPATVLPGISAALRLELLTVIWMIVEAVGALTAALLARSVLLLAFGIDSGIELLSALVLFWRLRKDASGQLDTFETEAVERRATRFAGWLLCLLAMYVTLQAAYSLWQQDAAETSFLGIAIAVIAAIGMPILSRAKIRIANQIGSAALRADSIETLTCGYLSWLVLVGLVANAFLHWWWLDSAASLAIVPIIVREGSEALRGETRSCHHH